MLAFVKVMLSHGHDPAKRLWVQCQDVDRTAALMCYLQLSLWNVPAVVIVGNTLAMEVREAFYTPAHYLGFWGARLRRRDDEDERVDAREDLQSLVTMPVSDMPTRPAGALQQFDFGF